MKLLKQEGLVNDANDQIIMIGLQKLGNVIFDAIFAVVCSRIMGNAMAGVIYETGYGILRIYAGGYHAKSKMICTTLTYLSTLFSILLIFFMPFSSSMMYFLLAVCIYVIICIAPVESVNKPLNKLERKVFYKYCISIALAEVFVCCMFEWLGFVLYARAVSIAIFQVVIGMVVVERK